jgi:hypothetical protein
MSGGAGGWKKGWFLGLAAMALACGGKDDEGPSRPVAACQDFAVAWCARSMDRRVQEGTLTAAERDPNYDECHRVAVAAVPCDRAVVVGAQYDQCISQVRGMDCQAFAGPIETLRRTPPAAREGVIGVQ